MVSEKPVTLTRAMIVAKAFLNHLPQDQVKKISYRGDWPALNEDTQFYWDVSDNDRISKGTLARNLKETELDSLQAVLTFETSLSTREQKNGGAASLCETALPSAAS